MMEQHRVDAPDLAGSFAGFAEQQTPAVVINGAALTANLIRMQGLARAGGG